MVVTQFDGAFWLLPFTGLVLGVPWFVPVVAGAVLSRLFGGGGGNKQTSGGGGSTGYPDPGVPPIGPQGGMIFEQGSPFWPGSVPAIPSNWQQQQTGQGGGGGGGGSSSSSQSTGFSDSTTTAQVTQQPFFVPGFEGLGGQVKGFAESLLSQPFSIPRGYQANGLANIGDAFAASATALENRLSGSGIAGPMAAGAFGGLLGERAKAQASFTNDLPMLERTLRQEDLNLAASILEAFGKGTRQDSKSRTQTSTKSSTSGQSSGGGGGVAAPVPMIGDAIASQYFNRPQSGGTNWGGILGGIATLAPIILSLLNRGKGGGGGGGGKSSPSGGGVLDL